MYSYFPVLCDSDKRERERGGKVGLEEEEVIERWVCQADGGSFLVGGGN